MDLSISPIQTNVVPNIVPNITNLDLSCVKYFEQETVKIHQYSLPHNLEFIDQVSI